MPDARAEAAALNRALRERYGTRPDDLAKVLACEAERQRLKAIGDA